MSNLPAMRGNEHEKSRVMRIAKGYARGGAIPSDAMMANAIGAKKAMPAKKALGKIDGARPKMRLDKFARGGAVGKKGGAKTNVNVIVAPQGGGGDKPPMPMPMPPAMAAAPAPRPPMPMPGAPPGAMPPGLGPKPFNAGGPVRGKMGRFAKGGRVTMTAGAESGLGRLQKTAIQKRKG